MRSAEEIEEILNLHNEGYSYNQIAKLKNTNKSIIAFYCNEKRNKNVIERQKERERNEKEYEEIICKLVKNNDNINQVCRILNKRPTNTNIRAIKNVIDKYKISIGHFRMKRQNKSAKKLTDDEVFKKRDRFYNIALLKKRLFDKGYKERKCEICGISEWNEKPISLQIHHINGDNCDNRIENLQVLCPNCHSQTDTYCGRNKKNK